MRNLVMCSLIVLLASNALFSQSTAKLDNNRAAKSGNAVSLCSLGQSHAKYDGRKVIVRATAMATWEEAVLHDPRCPSLPSAISFPPFSTGTSQMLYNALQECKSVDVVLKGVIRVAPPDEWGGFGYMKGYPMLLTIKRILDLQKPQSCTTAP